MKSVFLISVRTALISEFTLKRIAPSERCKNSQSLGRKHGFLSSTKKITTTHSLFDFGLLFFMCFCCSSVLSQRYCKQSLNELDIFAWREVLPALFHSAAESKGFGFQRRTEVSSNSPIHVQHKTTAAEFIY